MTDDREIRDRAYAIWQREGGGDHERLWHQAAMEIDREAALPLTADDPLPREIASTDVLEVEELAMPTGISGDDAQALLDRLGTDHAARGRKARKAAKS
ncbi:MULTISPECIES: DUF2934 domain-containing protein [unclassified Mesorhizobium]|uniref:DUF2934 domain-containing protein n=1 Tax=unclassified Mesorhizobium TaxID=325217 RepID=UPI000BAF9855|nr:MULTISPECIES: DUF2934 domain-containing protein [unclassified Mesorhizobium]PBC19717.1 hypothetical protein CK226_28005 [Mesorhizobium sp. WSM4311]TRD02109.1 DUF2934 domain-containing protein [Mesorhizobium sp. WSM4305]